MCFIFKQNIPKSIISVVKNTAFLETSWAELFHIGSGSRLLSCPYLLNPTWQFYFCLSDRYKPNEMKTRGEKNIGDMKQERHQVGFPCPHQSVLAANRTVTDRITCRWADLTSGC